MWFLSVLRRCKAFAAAVVFTRGRSSLLMPFERRLKGLTGLDWLAYVSSLNFWSMKRSSQGRKSLPAALSFVKRNLVNSSIMVT